MLSSGTKNSWKTNNKNNCSSTLSPKCRGFYLDFSPKIGYICGMKSLNRKKVLQKELLRTRFSYLITQTPKDLEKFELIKKKLAEFSGDN